MKAEKRWIGYTDTLNGPPQINNAWNWLLLLKCVQDVNWLIAYFSFNLFATVYRLLHIVCVRVRALWIWFFPFILMDNEHSRRIATNASVWLKFSLYLFFFHFSLSHCYQDTIGRKSNECFECTYETVNELEWRI